MCEARNGSGSCISSGSASASYLTPYPHLSTFWIWNQNRNRNQNRIRTRIRSNRTSAQRKWLTNPYATANWDSLWAVSEGAFCGQCMVNVPRYYRESLCARIQLQDRGPYAFRISVLYPRR